ncbi:MAG: MgpA protein [Candidatus Moranbacteria bacterium GW2011_GWE2_35_2-]|nr:MAG: MgpA protein [Candidatus Moranbacteria bacterium GW2011_GWE2_35_2-]KKQ05147.1 MAG: MgpA protein [Candidatus Moranbacteria bacterium GW2011_GWF1_36_4]KKQ22386.1 MAG: MgpA protein [Candidatus Moranbacteria bacterium GW2011_GWF2_37_11]KKQ29454.1 MAG: MgpA protein [Candidatus Moranbacteria bacterium GW2011_GWD1_37_17]KKQ30678.1 MAG: MgpA protein [Candidatus Moranbacteria bacterium GW2011_GWE1_37_24]KKQ47117.1 MAG: MgpA protein [Candidatus Moranbacteria bacterium GW2011_GWD2_37_9]HBO17079.
MKNEFSTEFKTLQYIIENSSRILLFAHSRPDGDTVGSVLALQEYLKKLGKHIDIACFDPFPEYLAEIVPGKFNYPDNLNINSYDSIIACDSVERGFEKIYPLLNPKQVSIIIDHHPDITLTADLRIVDSQYSSVCEIIYKFLVSINAETNLKIANCLLLGIISDTGNLQHSNTTADVMEIASKLIKKGASVSKIVGSVFSNKKITTLKLWGRAFEKARINPKNKMIVTVLTQEDIKQCEASTDDIAQIASILNAVPGTSFSLVLSQRDNKTIKGSLRSEQYKGIDVSEIAHLFGGGGHKLASGFEIKGKIVEDASGWKII